MFNPTVNVFRIHWFAVRPCFELVSSRSLSRFGAGVLHPRHYYEAKTNDHSLFTLSRLGRRSQFTRTVNGKKLKPHKFWSLYMSDVASEHFRGAWNGLAPMHFHFKPEPGKKLLALLPEINLRPDKLLAGVTKIRAFPKAYLCPAGWIVAISAEIEGAFPFNTLPSLIDRLRTQKVFLYKGSPAALKDVLREMHLVIRGALLDRDEPQVEDNLAIYSVSSPVAFQEQLSFDPMGEQLDLQAILAIVGEGPPPAENRRLVTPGPNNIAVTAFNRGTMLITRGSGSPPECALSNLKNLLLMTVFMQKYHQRSFGHSDPEVLSMREEVAQTFRVLESRWESPHFKQICAQHDGIIKMLQEEPAPIKSSGTFEMQTQRLNTILAFVFGVIFIAAILALVVLIPNPTVTQWKVFCVVLALAAGGISTTISGMLKIDLTFTKRAVIGATGALAVFVIVYFFVPAMAK
jgi:hypothetical protein